VARKVRDIRSWLNDRRMHRAARLIRMSPLWRYSFEGGEPFARPSPEVDARVRKMFEAEVAALEQISGRDLSAWKVSAGRPRTPGAGE
ncbi:MAG: hypothetical protein ACYDC3_02085, partial [Candidatus Binataceae bacterium]